MTARPGLRDACAPLAGGLMAALLAVPAAQADRGRDSVWIGAEPAPVAAVGPATQSVRLVVRDPARPTFDLRGARHLLLAQLPSGEDDGGVPDFRPLGETRTLAAPSDPDPEDTDSEELDPDDLDFGMEDLESGIEDNGDIDPLESINRPIFDANIFLDRWLLRPVTRVYIETVPEPGRKGVSNFLRNLRTPVILANDLLQGEMSRAGATFGRFFVNTFFGLAGLIDTADALGLPGHEEDFGQTLGSYGIGDKPYLMLPLIGPSNPRDVVGRIGDIFMDPLTYLTPDELSEIETGINVVNDRAQVINDTDALEATSIDYYAAVRSFYFQNRRFEVSNGREPAPGAQELQSQDELYDDLEGAELDALDEELQLE